MKTLFFSILFIALLIAGCGDNPVNQSVISKDVNTVNQTVTIQFIGGGDTTFNCDKIIYEILRTPKFYFYYNDEQILCIMASQIQYLNKK